MRGVILKDIKYIYYDDSFDKWYNKFSYNYQCATASHIMIGKI